MTFFEHGRLFAQWFCPCGQCYPRDQNNHMAAPVKDKPHRNLHQHAPELFGTLRNLPNPASGTYTNTRRNSPEPCGTRLQNLHPAHTGTLQNLPEPSSGTCSCNPHRHTPELIWAEDPISLRCWGKKHPISRVGNVRSERPSHQSYQDLGLNLKLVGLAESSFFVVVVQLYSCTVGQLDLVPLFWGGKTWNSPFPTECWPFVIFFSSQPAGCWHSTRGKLALFRFNQVFYIQEDMPVARSEKSELNCGHRQKMIVFLWDDNVIIRWQKTLKRIW